MARERLMLLPMMMTMTMVSPLLLLLLLLQLLSIVSVSMIVGAAPNENNLVEDSQKNTLRQVSLVIRHGHRSPQSTYATDPYKDDPMEPFGWGQLTSEGRLSQYNQGLYLRDRYGKFLGTKYSPEIFWLQSTAADRAKMSALLEAAALWKPDGDQTFLNGLAWQPTSLNYQTSDKDSLLLIWATCPDYARTRESILKSSEIQHINQINKDLYEALTKYTGQNISNPDDVFDVYSTLEAEESMGYKLPNWTRDYFPHAMTPLSSLSLKINVYNETLLKMKIAPLITKITNNMIEKSQGILKPEKRKMFMYVGHDSTVSNLLEGLKVWDGQIPSYSIMVMIELHENEFGYSVQLYLRNTTMHEARPLIIPGCTFDCPLLQFMDLLNPLLMNENQWKKECTLKDANYKPGLQPLP